MSKPLEWVGSSYKDLTALPEAVQDTFGYALDLAQRGLKHDEAKSFTQAGGGVMEVVEDEEFSGEPWYYFGPHDVFPEQWLPFLCIPPALSPIFMQHHAELLTAAWWRGLSEHRLGAA